MAGSKMSTHRRLHWKVLTGILLAFASPGLAEDLEINLGSPATHEEQRASSVTVFPDGRGLPPGSGSVREGAELYLARCSSCHGERGIEGPASRLAGTDGFVSLRDPLRLLRINKHPLLVMSVGAQWPYATSLFDYIRRAMPHVAPKSLNNNEVYALTAYILYLNDLIDEKAVMTRKNLPGVEMPGRARSVDLSRDQ